MPKLGLTMSEGVLVNWLAESGSRVEKGQPLFEIETDKMLTEATAEADGILHTVAVAGSTVAVLEVVGYLLDPGEEPPSPEPVTHETGNLAETPPPISVDERSPAGRRLASPAAKRRARELGIDLSQVTPSGNDGRITEADVESAAERTGEVHKMDRTRQMIADRLLASSRESAAVTLTTEVDATELVGLRRGLGGHASPPSYNAIFVKIVARCLSEFPEFNAWREGDEIRLPREIAVAVAVDTPRGLLAPVVHEVPRKPVRDVSRELDQLAERAINGKSQPGDLDGGSFTITNLGAFGVDAFTPIINPPQMAILGVGRIQRKPAAWQDRIELRDRLTLSLTFDHRWIDGAPAARFLHRISELVEASSFLSGETA